MQHIWSTIIDYEYVTHSVVMDIFKDVYSAYAIFFWSEINVNIQPLF